MIIFEMTFILRRNARGYNPILQLPIDCNIQYNR